MQQIANIHKYPKPLTIMLNICYNRYSKNFEKNGFTGVELSASAVIVRVQKKQGKEGVSWK